jgi:hypothetical protein
MENGGAVVVAGEGLEARQAEFSGLGAPSLDGRILHGGLNFICSEVEITSLTIANAESDALDSDFSGLRFDTITCHAIQNDCLDTSRSTVSYNRLAARGIGGKGVSL